MENHDVEHQPENHRFVVICDHRVSQLTYRVADDGVWELYSTFVPPACRGKGIAQKLAEAALEFARENGLKVAPSCSFVARYIDAHPEYKELAVR